MRRIIGIIVVILCVWAAWWVFMTTMDDDALIRDMKDAFSNTDGLIAVTGTVMNGNLSTPYTDNVVYYKLEYQEYECDDDDCYWSMYNTVTDAQTVDMGYHVQDPAFDVFTYTVRDEQGSYRVLEYTIVRGDDVTVWGQYDGDMIVPHDVHLVSTDYVKTFEGRVRKVVWTQNSAALILILMWVLLLLINYRRQYSWRVK